MIAGEPPSLSGSKSIVIKNFGDLFVPNAAVTHLENSADDISSDIVDNGSTNRAGPFLTLAPLDWLLGLMAIRERLERLEPRAVLNSASSSSGVSGANRDRATSHEYGVVVSHHDSRATVFMLEPLSLV